MSIPDDVLCRVPATTNMPRGMTDDFRGVRLVPTTSLQSASYSLRTKVAAREASDTELTRSVAASGMIQPLIVRPTTKRDAFEVVAGERRLAAARALGLAEVLCVIQTCSDDEALLMSLTENLQRKDLDSIEKARGFTRLLEEFHLTQHEIAKRLGVSQSAIAHHLRLLLLPAEVQTLIQQGSLSMGHGKLLAGVANPSRTVELALKCSSEGLSVRQLEQELAHAAHAEDDRRARRRESPTKPKLECELPNGVFVVIKESATEPKSGTIEIPFYSQQEMEWIMAKLGAPQKSHAQTLRGTNAAHLKAQLPVRRMRTAEVGKQSPV